MSEWDRKGISVTLNVARLFGVRLFTGISIILYTGRISIKHFTQILPAEFFVNLLIVFQFGLTCMLLTITLQLFCSPNSEGNASG